MNHTIESGKTGRVAYARVAPNEDLVGAVEKFCAAEGFRHAFVRGSLGSLIDACLAGPNGTVQQIAGPAVEILSMGGEVRPGADGDLVAALSGVVADPQGRLYGGPFVAGHNPVLMTFELTLEEWVPDSGV
ncbi:MAG TPA: PPC domain-containing DNA-binding protein [Bordetella sp.]